VLEIGLALLFGFGFGFLLHKAGLTHYATITNVYRLRDWTVLKFMLSALVTGSVLVRIGIDLGLQQRALLPPTFALSNLVGGVVFGVGMATAGYCPGTIVAEAGEGRYDAWLGGLSGLIVGAVGFGLMQPHIMPSLSSVASLGRIDLAEMVHVPGWLTLTVVVELMLLALALAARPSLKNKS